MNYRKMISLVVAVVISFSAVFTVDLYSVNAASYDVTKKAITKVSKANRNRCITCKGAYTLTAPNRGIVVRESYRIAYFPNKYIDEGIKNIKKAKVNDEVSLILGLVPNVGAGFAIGAYLKNKRLDSIISELKKKKKSGENARVEIFKIAGFPYGYKVKSWNGKDIMKTSYTDVTSGGVHKMTIKKSDVDYGKK